MLEIFSAFFVIVLMISILSWVWPKLLFAQNRKQSFVHSIKIFIGGTVLGVIIAIFEDHEQKFYQALQEQNSETACYHYQKLSSEVQNTLASQVKELKLMVLTEMQKHQQSGDYIRVIQLLTSVNQCLNDAEIGQYIAEFSPQAEQQAARQQMLKEQQAAEQQALKEQQQAEKELKTRLAVEDSEQNWELVALAQLHAPKEIMQGRGWNNSKLVLNTAKNYDWLPCVLSEREKLLINNSKEIELKHSRFVAVSINPSDLAGVQIHDKKGKVHSLEGIDRFPLCDIKKGKWVDEITYEMITDPDLVVVEPIVPMKEIKKSMKGFEATWLDSLFSRYSSGLVVTNKKHKRGDLSDYIPKQKHRQCQYVEAYANFKRVSGLSFSKGDMKVINKIHQSDLPYLEGGKETECWINSVYRKGILSGRLYGKGEQRHDIQIRD